jgi:hypothetical protein
MLRKLNFTERARIPRAAVRIALRRDAGGTLTFDPTLDLSAIAVPGDARVYIEAHYRTSYMRFDCGTVTEVTPPEERRLTEIESSSVVRFRVKVVDAGGHRILAAADDITVSAESEEGGSRISLLPVTFLDLGELPWRVEMESSGPVLELNNRIDGIERLARNDAQFFALVYPAAVREILTRILIVDGYEAFDESDEWWGLWMRWARDMIDAPPPSERDDHPLWIDDVIAAFCGRHSVIQKMHPAEPEDQP